MDANKIYNATCYDELGVALQDYMNEFTYEWWIALDPENRKAIRLLGFSHSVISSMLFFDDRNFNYNCDFGWHYSYWGNLLVQKIEQITNEKMQDNFLQLYNLLSCNEDMNKIREVITARIVPLGLSEKVQRAAFDDLISKNENYQRFHNRFYGGIDTIRRKALWEAFNKIQREDKGE